VILDKDTGPANGLNKGFAAASGEIFGYINADDAYLPGALRKAVVALQARPQADVVYGHCYIVDREGRMVRRSRSVPFNLRLYAYGGVVVMQQSTFFRRKAFERAGGFNEANRTSWDAELLMDMALKGSRLEIVDDYWSVYAIYPGSITATVKYNQQYEADRARMFRAITGRDQAQTNKIFFVLARIEKLLRNPLVPVHRIIDKTPARSRLPALAMTALS
jgi:glycosyltransferase involved in cell wall biosynthesis